MKVSEAFCVGKHILFARVLYMRVRFGCGIAAFCFVSVVGTAARLSNDLSVS